MLLLGRDELVLHKVRRRGIDVIEALLIVFESVFFTFFQRF